MLNLPVLRNPANSRESQLTDHKNIIVEWFVERREIQLTVLILHINEALSDALSRIEKSTDVLAHHRQS